MRDRSKRGAIDAPAQSGERIPLDQAAKMPGFRRTVIRLPGRDWLRPQPSVPDYARRLAEALDNPNMRHLVRTVPGIAPPPQCYPDTRSAFRRFVSKMIQRLVGWTKRRRNAAEK